VLFDGVNIRYFASGEKIPEKHQLRVEFDDNSSLVCSVQMYGGILLTGADDGENGYYLSSKTKISPLSEENTEEYFFGLMDGVRQNYSVKAFLATEQRFPGLGNGVLQDILFNAKIHPRRKLETLSQREKEAIYNSVRHTLCEMTAGGGRDTEKDLFGRPGGYRTKLSAKTKDSPCPVCGDIITREAFMGGNVYFCPVCQRYER
ncbi:MAG: endonuclease VIII, partial [Eubacteriales bacterium]|nr:endonuclease VIII [Eubacteriales bacterium]